MQRYFIKPGHIGEDSVELTGEDAHHAVRVMRMKPGDELIVCDGEGRDALAEIREAAPDRVEAAILERLRENREPSWEITVAQSLPKGDKMEWVIQKGTEIGAYAFMPFQSERMIVQYDAKKEAKRLERWSKIAKEAAEQAHRSRIPYVEPLRSWKELLACMSAFDLSLFCYEKEGASGSGGLRDAARRARGQAGKAAKGLKVLLIVGPEGGFTEREAAEAEGAGAVIVGLGRRILRTETAGLVGLTCLLYESGEMGGLE